ALDAAVRRDEARAPLLREPGGADAIGHADRLEYVVHRRQQRLADVEAREAIALEQHDLPAGAGERGRGGRARRPAANHDHIAIELPWHLERRWWGCPSAPHRRPRARPPSTWITDPVAYGASPRSSDAMTRPTSAGVPQRPSGTSPS